MLRFQLFLSVMLMCAASQCGMGCGADSDCSTNPTCSYCIYGKCNSTQSCPATACKDSRACPMGEGKGLCSRCITGNTPAPSPPTPTPPPAKCTVCVTGAVCCNPSIPAQRCPGNIACCNCGSDSCTCPSSAESSVVHLPTNNWLATNTSGHCGLGLPCGSPCVLDGDCDQTGSCRACGGTGQCTHSN